MQNVVFQQIGFDGNPWDRLLKVSTGGMIITALGFVPGKQIFYFYLFPEVNL
jgi:PHS family inorganic phosphate transporter-like MFS transporter